MKGATLPEVDSSKIRELSDAVQGPVLEPLQEANERLPNLRAIDQDLYTSVTPALAVNYTLGTSYMLSMVQGAADTFSGLSEALAASAQDWDDTEQVNAKQFE